MMYILSEYAGENINEFLAEAWSEYMNNPNPRPVAKRIGEIILEMNEERKKSK